ncbi:MAG: hypothetical protein ACXVAY_00495 [Mucilaginibacter sp.]
MKIYLSAILLLFGVSTTLFAQEVWTDHSRLLPDQLRNIPDGVFIYHNPTPVYPEINTDTINYPGKYIWKHSTYITSTVSGLRVVAAGSYIWYSAKGWIKNIVMDNAGFAERFNCRDGRLRKGKTYVFTKNYRFGDVIYPGDALWFVIVTDEKGNRYKGIALVETEGTLKQTKQTKS